ncbi:MAG: hypothetical protein ACK5YO_06095, partial [Planctomyces sp.]
MRGRPMQGMEGINRFLGPQNLIFQQYQQGDMSALRAWNGWQPGGKDAVRLQSFTHAGKQLPELVRALAGGCLRALGVSAGAGQPSEGNVEQALGLLYP